MPSKTLSQMAIPLVISFTLRFMFSMVDMAYAAVLTDDNDAVAAIGFFLPFQSLHIALWIGLSAGFTSALSSAFGYRDEERVTQLKRTMARILAMMVPTLALLGVGLYFATPLFGLEPGLERAFRIYGSTLMIGMPLTGFWSIYPDSIVKAHQDTRSTMIAGLVSTIANIVLNTLFVFAFGMGIFGIAIATVISRLAGLAYASHRTWHLESARNTETWQCPVRDWVTPARAILLLAIPGSVTHLLLTAEGALINGILRSLPNSTNAIASYGIYDRILTFALMPAVATSVAIVPYVGRSLPEGRHTEVLADIKRALIWTSGLALLITVPIGWIFADDVAGFFVKDTSMKMGTHGITSPLTLTALHILPLTAICAGPFLLLRPVFEAALKPRLGTIVSLLRFACLSIPLILIGSTLAPTLGFDGLLGTIAGLGLAGLLASLATTLLAIRVITNSADQ